MPLDKKTRQKIETFVKEKPRNMQEIAHTIGKSWRTADRYVKQIAQEEGTIATRTFREGTRGALKVVYWRTQEQLASSRFKELLLKQIEGGRRKTDFSPFDIYQCVDEEKREAFLEQQEEEAVNVKQDLAGALKKAEEEILIFSGNLSWANLQQEEQSFLNLFTELGERSIRVKFLGAVDVTSVKNADALLALNDRVKEDFLSVRHHVQPLRAFVVDDRFVRFKESRHPDAYREEEVGAKTYVFYEIRDCDWVEWVRKVFWNLWRGALPAEKRVEDLRTIQNLDVL